MDRRRHQHCRAGLCLVILLGCGAPVQAAWIGYRNDTPHPVIVQGSSTIGGVIRKGQPHGINPRETAWDQVAAGIKTITVFDPRQPNRVLWQGQIPIGDKDLFFSIQVEIGADKQPRLKLVPAAPPAGMTRRPPR